MLFRDFANQIDGMSLKVFSRYARTSRFTYDIGMNAGMYLYFAAANRARGAKIFGFEPNGELAQVVDRNVRRNGIADVDVINAAVSDHKGFETLFITNTDHMHSLSRDFLDRSKRPVISEVTVPTIQLDQFIEQRSVGADLIKIDVEGVEADVISGARSIIDSTKPTLLVEITERNLSAPGIDSLFKSPYECFYIRANGLTRIEDRIDLTERRQAAFENYLFTTKSYEVRDLLI